MPTTLTSMVSAAIVSSIVESTSRQLEGIFGELEGTSVGVEIVSIKQDPPHQRALKKSPFFMTKTENAYDL